MNWKHPLFRAFFIWLMGMIGLIFLFSKDYYPLKTNRPPFQSTAQSTLYFKNLRSYFYFSYEDPASKFRVYRWKRWEDQWTTATPFVNWMLVENWRNDEVYVLLKPNDQAIAQGYTVFISDFGSEQGADTLHLDEANTLEQEALAEKVYAALGSSEMPQFELKSNMDPTSGIPLFRSEKDLKALQTLLEDYFKWTGKR